MGDRRVGLLILKTNGNLQFRYDPQYDGPAISQALPIQTEAHGHAVVRATLGGLLPEGDVRTALAQAIGISSGNDYRLLEQLGGDVAGALTLLPPGVDPPLFPSQEPIDDERLDVLLTRLPQRPLALDEEDGIRLSLAGAQPKLPVIIDNGKIALPTNSAAATTHILKPEPVRFPGLVDNEAFCLSLARACDLQVAFARKATTRSGLPYLIVDRYDRDLTVSPTRRLHQEDFCQALGVASESKYQQEGGPTFAQCASLIRRVTPVPALELPSLLRAIAFSWIVGNCDAHGKNYSLLYDGGPPVLAPLYDLVSTVEYPELTTRLAMNIGAARTIDDVTMQQWERLADDAGYRPAFARASVQALLDRARQEAGHLTELSEHRNATAQSIAGRIQRLRT